MGKCVELFDSSPSYRSMTKIRKTFHIYYSRSLDFLGIEPRGFRKILLAASLVVIALPQPGSNCCTASARKECEAPENSRRSFASPLAAILWPRRRFLLIEEIM
jgi:hypothetical protein